LSLNSKKIGINWGKFEFKPELEFKFRQYFRIKPIGQNSGTHSGFESEINSEKFEFKLELEFEFG
jgi:hypothetical protein